jgi:uncharacterized membrane protein
MPTNIYNLDSTPRLENSYETIVLVITVLILASSLTVGGLAFHATKCATFSRVYGSASALHVVLPLVLVAILLAKNTNAVDTVGIVIASLATITLLAGLLELKYAKKEGVPKGRCIQNE